MRTVQIFNRLASPARGDEDRLSVILQHLEPGLNVGCVVGARFVGDSQIGAKERRAEFSNKFFHRVCVIGESLTKLAVETVLGSRPMRFMPISA